MNCLWARNQPFCLFARAGSSISGKVLIFSSALDLIESLYNQKGNDLSNPACLNSAIKRLDALDFSDAAPTRS
jgi:hypothetical protein